MPARPVTDASFDREVMHSKLPVVVDFWAPGCGHCVPVGRVLDKLADEYAGQVKVCKVDVTSSARVAKRLGVSSVPTVLALTRGQLVESLVGAQPAATYRRLVGRLAGK